MMRRITRGAAGAGLVIFMNGTCLADTVAVDFAEQAGALVGAAAACDAPEVEEFSRRVGAVLDYLALNADDVADASTRFGEAMRSALVRQSNPDPALCERDRQALREMPLMLTDDTDVFAEQLLATSGEGEHR